MQRRPITEPEHSTGGAGKRINDSFQLAAYKDRPIRLGAYDVSAIGQDDPPVESATRVGRTCMECMGIPIERALY